MAWKIALGVWGLLLTGGIVLSTTGGTGPETVDLVAGTIVLVALWGVVKLPWDLYFAARNVQLDQAESVDREVKVSEAERAETVRLTRRLLALALGLHLLGAGICAAASTVTDGKIGLFAAGAFLITMLLRPTGAMVVHVQRRLAELKRRAFVPRADARELESRIRALESHVGGMHSKLNDERTGLEALHTYLISQNERLERAQHKQEQRHKADLDRLGLEMERALEKLSRDQEVLAGLRAFLQMVRQS